MAKFLIILFVLWHMLAIGIYAIPSDTRDTRITWIRETLYDVVKPYVLITSQWQQWNLFSPDPLRRVTEYTVEIDDHNAPKELITWKPGSVSWWRHATFFKFLGSLLEEQNVKREFLERLLYAQCREFSVPENTPIRIKYTYYVIPKHTRNASVSWWQQWEPERHVSYSEFVLCPSFS